MAFHAPVDCPPILNNLAKYYDVERDETWMKFLLSFFFFNFFPRRQSLVLQLCCKLLHCQHRTSFVVCSADESSTFNLRRMWRHQGAFYVMATGAQGFRCQKNRMLISNLIQWHIWLDLTNNFVELESHNANALRCLICPLGARNRAWKFIEPFRECEPVYNSCTVRRQ